MTYHIIVQPDLKLAVFSTGTNAFYLYDAEDKEIEEFFVKKAADDARRSIRRTLEEINAGTYQPHWPISFEDAEQLHNKYTNDPIPFGFREPSSGNAT